MKIISIKELHDATGRYVRESKDGPLIVTDHGEEVAVIKAYSPLDLPGRPFPRRNPDSLPRVGTDSTSVIFDDRDGR